MQIAVGFDERMPVVDSVLRALAETGHGVVEYGPETGQIQAWSRVAQQVAEDVASGRADQGILFCWTGTGVSIAANKVRGVRAALCADAETARGARLWNNANVLCLSIRLTSETVAREILAMWFATVYVPNPADDACIAILE